MHRALIASAALPRLEAGREATLDRLLRGCALGVHRMPLSLRSDLLTLLKLSRALLTLQPVQFALVGASQPPGLRLGLQLIEPLLGGLLRLILALQLTQIALILAAQATGLRLLLQAIQSLLGVLLVLLSALCRAVLQRRGRRLLLCLLLTLLGALLDALLTGLSTGCRIGDRYGALDGMR
jgi:hypothetical protein